MKTRYDAETLARKHSSSERTARGAIRRMVIKATKTAQWLLQGHRIENKVEPVDADAFTGVGFYARPRTSSRSEAVVVSIGDAEHTVIVATRDEDLRRLWKTELDAGVDVAAMFNSATIILCKADGTVEVRSRGGTAQSLATKADLETLKAAIEDSAVVANDGGASLKATLLTALAAWPTGTTVLKGE